MGKEYIAELKNVVAECKDIVFFARDKASYEVLKRDIGLSMDNCFYTPDMVTYFDYSNEEERTTNILFVFRNDCEGVLNDVLESKLTEIREMQEMQVVKTNTHATVYVNKNNRISVLNDKLKEFSRASLVITDRLHAMLFAAITGTPCIAFDNKSKKVSGQYEWIKNLDYVIQISPEAFTTELVQKMMKKNGRYSNKELKKYYDIMAEIIKKRMI